MNDATPEQREAVYQRLEIWFGGSVSEEQTETYINDIVWFDCEDIFFPNESED